MLCAIGFLAIGVAPSSSQIYICNNTQGTLEVAYVSAEMMVGWQEVRPHVGCTRLGVLEAQEIDYGLEILARPKGLKKVVEVESVTNGSVEDGSTLQCVHDGKLSVWMDPDNTGQPCEKPWFEMPFQRIVFDRTPGDFEIVYGKM
jgi:hypothetical protein